MIPTDTFDRLDPEYMDLRLRLLRDAMDKPVRRVVQVDHVGDEDGVSMGTRPALRRTAIPMRVEIIAGTPKEKVLALLDEIRTAIEELYDDTTLEWTEPPF